MLPSGEIQDQQDWKLLEMAHGIVGMKPTTVTFDESDRQATLLALAALAVERPGWDYMLNLIALKMDRDVDGQAFMFTVLKDIRQRRLVPDMPHKAFILDSVPLTELMKGMYGNPIEAKD